MTTGLASRGPENWSAWRSFPQASWTGKHQVQLDRVVDRWQRMLSSADARTRLYFYLFRRASRFEDDDPAASSVAAVGRRKRMGFLG